MSVTHRAGTLALAATLLLGTAACGSGDSSTAGTPSGSSSPSSVGSSLGSPPSSTGGGTGAKADDCDTDRDANNLSRSASVIYTADSKSKVKTKDITPANTLTLKGGALTPSTLTIKVGEGFAITAPGSSAGSDGIRVGCADGQTTYGDLPIGWVLLKAGTYDISSDADKTKLGSVTAA